MNDLVKSVRATGGIGVVASSFLKIRKPRQAGEESKIVFVSPLLGQGQHIGPDRRTSSLQRYLRDLIHTDRAKPS